MKVVFDKQTVCKLVLVHKKCVKLTGNQ